MKESNYSKYDHDFALKWAKKIKAVNFLGGKCKICNKEGFLILDFHHRDGEEKEEKISFLIRHKRWKCIEDELKKCDLLCRNCHAEFHSKNSGRYAEKKHKLLEYKSLFYCEKCGYSGKNYASIDFHHTSDDKLFSIRDKSTLSVKNLFDEIDKCSVLCRNCHQQEHIDIEKINQLWDFIQFKVHNHKGQNSPVNKIKVFEMLKNGSSQIEISRELRCAKSTICRIVKLAD